MVLIGWPQESTVNKLAVAHLVQRAFTTFPLRGRRAPSVVIAAPRQQEVRTEAAGARTRCARLPVKAPGREEMTVLRLGLHMWSRHTCGWWLLLLSCHSSWTWTPCLWDEGDGLDKFSTLQNSGTLLKGKKMFKGQVLRAVFSRKACFRKYWKGEPPFQVQRPVQPMKPSV